MYKKNINGAENLKSQFRGNYSEEYKSPIPSFFSVENINIGKDYAFTLSLPDNEQPYEEMSFERGPVLKNESASFAINSCEAWSTRYRNIFCSLKGSSVVLYLEYSKAFRFHFHGTIRIHDIFKFISVDLKKLLSLGNCDFDTIGDDIEDMMYWDLYCRKLQILHNKSGCAHLWRYGLQLTYRTDDNERGAKIAYEKFLKEQAEKEAAKQAAKEQKKALKEALKAQKALDQITVKKCNILSF